MSLLGSRSSGLMVSLTWDYKKTNNRPSGAVIPQRDRCLKTLPSRSWRMDQCSPCVCGEDARGERQ